MTSSLRPVRLMSDLQSDASADRSTPAPPSSMRSRSLADPQNHQHQQQQQQQHHHQQQQRFARASASHASPAQPLSRGMGGPFLRDASEAKQGSATLVSTSEVDRVAQPALSQWPSRDSHYTPAAGLARRTPAVSSSQSQPQSQSQPMRISTHLASASDPRTFRPDRFYDAISPLSQSPAQVDLMNRRPSAGSDQNALNWAANARLAAMPPLVQRLSIRDADPTVQPPPQPPPQQPRRWDRQSSSPESTAATSFDHHRARQQSLWNGQFEPSPSADLHHVSSSTSHSNGYAGIHSSAPRHTANTTIEPQNLMNGNPLTQHGYHMPSPYAAGFVPQQPRRMTSGAEWPPRNGMYRNGSADRRLSVAPSAFADQYAAVQYRSDAAMFQSQTPNPLEQQGHRARAITHTFSPPDASLNGALYNKQVAVQQRAEPLSLHQDLTSHNDGLHQWRQWQDAQSRMQALLADPARSSTASTGAGGASGFAFAHGPVSLPNQLPSGFAGPGSGHVNPTWPYSRPTQMSTLPDLEPGHSYASALLNEFHKVHNLRDGHGFELRDIYSHVVEFAGDQHGSRFIQTKLETANSDERNNIFFELLPNALQLMKDVFGNYVIQKFFEHGDQTQKSMLANRMKGQVLELTLQMYGCRVVQKALEHILVDQQAALVKELEHHVLKCIKDQHGNHVIQQAIERVPQVYIGFIAEAVFGQVQALATHNYGCRVVQRLLEYGAEPTRQTILQELHECALTLIADHFGNYVMQHVIENGARPDKERLIKLILDHFVPFAKQKFASNVVEKMIINCSEEDRYKIVQLLCFRDETKDERRESALSGMIRDGYANYVIQRLLKTLNDDDYMTLVAALQPELDKACRNGTNKQVENVQRKMDRFGLRRPTFGAYNNNSSIAGANNLSAAYRNGAPDGGRSAANTPSTAGDEALTIITSRSGSLPGSASGSSGSNSPFHVNTVTGVGGVSLCTYPHSLNQQH